ncbi:MAG TPA: hypothetical protein VGP08_18230 [Pyrinomonadaceae bacterium]|jgi:hypothetical protein|nr:hypothetical protein [Pyrinomonadaceae bacterium]
MNEDYSEDNLDFSQMSRDELYEIINSSLGVYRQQVVDGAKNELLRRELEGEPVESDRQVTNGEVRPPMLPEEERPPVLPESVPDGRLYSAWQIALASWMGSPAAGCLLLARNYEVLEKKRAAWQSLAAGVTATLLLLAISFVLPENFPGGRGFALVSGFAMLQIAKQLQGAAIDGHLRAGGEKGSWAVTVFVAIVVAGIIFALLVAAVVAFGLE